MSHHGQAKRELLADEIRAARLRLPVPGSGTVGYGGNGNTEPRLDRESLPAKFLALLMKHSGWKHFKSDDFDRDAVRALADLSADKLERCGGVLKQPRFAEWCVRVECECIVFVRQINFILLFFLV